MTTTHLMPKPGGMPSEQTQPDAVPITIAKGDGIGPEIMDSTLRILNAAGARLATVEGSVPRQAPVAQLDRASGYEPEGRLFESARAHHKNQ